MKIGAVDTTRRELMSAREVYESFQNGIGAADAYPSIYANIESVDIRVFVPLTTAAELVKNHVDALQEKYAMQLEEIGLEDESNG